MSKEWLISEKGITVMKTGVSGSVVRVKVYSQTGQCWEPAEKENCPGIPDVAEECFFSCDSGEQAWVSSCEVVG